MKGIKKIKQGLFKRPLSIAKIAIQTGATALWSKDQLLKGKLKDAVEKHLDQIVNELGVMKGSFMKAGQLLSLYAGAFLSPEAQRVLKALENQSYFLEWDVIKKRIPLEWFEKLEIEQRPLAAASLGQAHLSRNKLTQESFVMKIQYEGVKNAINSDIRALKWLLSVLNLLPKGLDLTEAFEEVKEMLHQETDYLKEKEVTMSFFHLTKSYPQYEVPRVIEDFSNDSILSTSFLNGISVNSKEAQEIPQAQRNQLGEDFMRLFFLEIFEWGLIQTDSHFGNYLILNDKDCPRWGLIDFGATKRPPEDFLTSYQNLMLSCALRDRELFFQSIEKMGYISKEKDSNTDLLWEYAELLGGPFTGGVYDWEKSSIPDRIFEMIPKLIKEVSVGTPPRHSVFIDRKIGGVFFTLKKLGSQFDPRKLIEEFIN